MWDMCKCLSWWYLTFISIWKANVHITCPKGKNTFSTLSCLSSFPWSLSAVHCFLFEITSAFYLTSFSLFLCDFCVHFDLGVSFCLSFTFFVALGKFNFPWLPYQSLLALSHIQSIKAIFFLFVREWRTVCPSSLYVGFSIPAVGNHSRKFFSSALTQAVRLLL